jgi:hypothetical protein
MSDTASQVLQSNLFRTLANLHPGVEVWPDAEFHDGGFDYFWICSAVDTNVHNLAYVRLQPSRFERRTYDLAGDDLWVAAGHH